MVMTSHSSNSQSQKRFSPRHAFVGGILTAALVFPGMGGAIETGPQPDGAPPLPSLATVQAAAAPAKNASETVNPAVATAKELVGQGIANLVMGQEAQAEAAFVKAQSLDPYSEESYNFLGLLYLQQGLHQKAEMSLKQAVAIEPMYVEALRNLGKLYLQLERFDDAVPYLKRSLALNRHQPYTSYLLGMALYFSGHAEEAIKAYEAALAEDPHMPEDVHYNLGVAYHETGRLLEAAREYETVLKVKPDHLNALNNLGLTLGGMGDRERAISNFEQVLKLNPKHAKAHINLGNVYLSTKNYVAAEKAYREAIALDDSDISARMNLGVIYFEQGRLADAEREWDAILSRQPNNLQVLSVMGSAFLEKKQVDRAIDVFRKMVDLLPDNGNIANTLGYLLADANRDLEQAKTLIEKAIRLDPSNRATYLDSLAWVHFRKGDLEQARTLQERSLALFRLTHEPASSEVLLHMGKIYVGLAQNRQARDAFQAAIDRGDDPEMVRLASESIALLEPTTTQ